MIEIMKISFYGWAISEMIFVHIYFLHYVFQLMNCLFNVVLFILMIFLTFIITDVLKLFKMLKLSDVLDKYTFLKNKLNFIFPLIILYSIIVFINNFGFIIYLEKARCEDNKIEVLIYSGIVLGLQLEFLKTFLDLNLKNIKNCFICLLFIVLNNIAYYYEAYWITELTTYYIIIVIFINFILMLKKRLNGSKIH